MRKLLAVALLALLAVTHAVEYEVEEEVLVLTEDTFDHAIAEFSHILVEFYAPWCGHCKKLAPEYAKAAQDLKNEGSHIKLAKVDATAHPTVSGKFEVRGYPTLKFFINGNAIPFEGGRTQGEIVNWVKRKVQASTKQVDTVEEFESIIKDHDVVVVFWGDSSNSHWGVFETVSRVFDDVQFVFTTHADLKTKYDADHDDIATLYKRFDEGVVDYEGDFTTDHLTTFIEEHQFPTIMGFDQKIAQKIFGEQTPALFLIVQSDEQGEKAQAALRAVAPKLKGKWYLSISNIDEGLGSRLAEFVGVTREELPAVRLLHPAPGGNPRKFKYSEDITPEHLYQFYEDFTAGHLHAYLKSEPKPAHQAEAVIVVVGETFHEVVMNDESDVLVEYYAPWCGHCKALAPEYLKAAEQLNTQGVKNVVLAKVDSTANEIEGVQVQGYPTIKFYPAHNKGSPVDFDGERNADGIVKWLKEHAKHAEWPAEAPLVDEL